MLRLQVPIDVSATFEFVLPPPRDVAMTVRAPDGTPIAAARIEIRGVAATPMPGLTDAEGRIILAVPEPTEANTGRLALWAVAPGHLTGRL